MTTRALTTIGNPKWLESLFTTTEYAWVWLMVRMYLGISWITAGTHKIYEDGAINEGWMLGGAAVKGFWTRAIAIPDEGRPAITFDWYRSFLGFMLEHDMYVVFGPMIAVGEVLVGVGLLVGALTGLAAFFGVLMNWSFMLAGTASTNPVLGILGLTLVLTWKTAGYYGLDRFIFRYIGVPGRKGELLGGETLVAKGHEERPMVMELERWGVIAIGAAMVAVATAYMEGMTMFLTVAIAAVILGLAGTHIVFKTKGGLKTRHGMA